MFVGQLSNDTNTNTQVVENFKQGKEAESLDLGRFVDPLTYKSLEVIRRADRFKKKQEQFGSPVLRMGEIASSINLGRHGDD